MKHKKEKVKPVPKKKVDAQQKNGKAKPTPTPKKPSKKNATRRKSIGSKRGKKYDVLRVDLGWV